MKKHSMPEMKEGGVNVTPLIDIVMCLIIFFMLVTKIGVSRGVDKDIVLPKTLMGQKIADMGDTVTLNVHYIGESSPCQLNINGKQIATPSKDDVGDGPLIQVLKEFKKTHTDPVTHVDNSKVIIHGDEALPYEQVETVLWAISKSGITDTAYEVVDKNPEADAAAPADK